MASKQEIPAEELVPELYDQLRELAERHFARQAADHTLQPTALVNEAYLKLAGHPSVCVGNRTHFMSLASRVMRQVLVDHARARRAGKRDHGAVERITLSEVAGDQGVEEVDLLALEEALVELAELSERMARLIELRFFGGLDEIEAAADRARGRRQPRPLRRVPPRRHPSGLRRRRRDPNLGHRDLAAGPRDERPRRLRQGAGLQPRRHAVGVGLR